MHNWSNNAGLVFANNAVYCDSGNFQISGLDGVVVTGNVVYPATGSIPSSGYSTGRSTILDLSDPTRHDVYPTQDSPMIDGGDPAWITVSDFNWTPRSGLPDAGAYTRTGVSNPGWTVGAGFKDTDPQPPEPPLAPANLSVGGTGPG